MSEDSMQDHVQKNTQETSTPTAMTAPTTSAANPQAQRQQVTWHQDQPPGPQTLKLCGHLAGIGTLYRTPDGHMVELKVGAQPRYLRDATDVEAFIRENIDIEIIKKGKTVGHAIPSADLNVLLRSSILMVRLPVVDRITEVPTYNAKWDLTKPGYNAGASGDSFFYTGGAIMPKREPVLIRSFLNRSLRAF